MKRLIVLLSVLLGCQMLFGQKRELPLKVVEANSQFWTSGAPGGKTGIKYSVKVYVNTAKKVEFKNFWLGKENVLFDVEFFSIEIQKKIQQGDSLLLTFNQISGEREDRHEAKRVPIDYKGVALIEVTIDRRARYFIVEKFEQLPPLRGQ